MQKLATRRESVKEGSRTGLVGSARGRFRLAQRRRTHKRRKSARPGPFRSGDAGAPSRAEVVDDGSARSAPESRPEPQERWRLDAQVPQRAQSREQRAEGRDAERLEAQSSSEPRRGALGHLSADEAQQQAVLSALIEQESLDTSDIAVGTASGKVILSGSVATPDAQRLALRVARATCASCEIDASALEVREH